MKNEFWPFGLILIGCFLLFSWFQGWIGNAEAQSSKPATPPSITQAPQMQKLPPSVKPQIAKAAAKSGETWYVANQGTISWDAPKTLADGSAIPTGVTIKYQAWRRAYSISLQEKSGGEITATKQTITFAPEGSFLVGVQAIRYDGTTAVSSSEIAWSDNAAVCKDGATFGFRHFLGLALPTGLRPTI